MKQLYSLYDEKTETWSNPFIHASLGDAIRSFTDAINDTNPQSLLVAHPEDFTLFHVGDFNEIDGVVTGITKKPVGNGIDFKKSEPDLPAVAAAN